MQTYDIKYTTGTEVTHKTTCQARSIKEANAFARSYYVQHNLVASRVIVAEAA